jgi:hypothetical protein
MPNVNGSTLAVPAARILRPYETGLIRRKGILKAAIARLAKLEKRVNEKLYPKIDAELRAQREDMKATVAVNTVVVEVKRVEQPRAQWQEIAKDALSENVLDGYLANPDFQSSSTSYFAKLVGRNTTFEQLLQG